MYWGKADKYFKYLRQSRLDISSVGCLAVKAFHVLGVKHIGYFKHLRSSSLGISCIEGKAVWASQVLDV